MYETYVRIPVEEVLDGDTVLDTSPTDPEIVTDPSGFAALHTPGDTVLVLFGEPR